MSKPSKAGQAALHFTAYMLLGYALAGPVRLSFYFYGKPFWDLLADGFLIIAAVSVSLKWLGAKGKFLIILIPFIALTWMKTEFILFSKAGIFAVFSYAFIALWGASFAAVWKFFDKEELRLRKWAVCLVAVSVGMLLRGADVPYWVIYVPTSVFTLSLYFIYSGNPRISKGVISIGACLLIIPLLFLADTALPEPRFYESQTKFHDKVVFSHDTPFQRIDITEWKGNHWFYQDGINQFSAIDSWLYFEPFAHPAMHLAGTESRVLIVGGENGMLAKELVKYNDVDIDLIPIDEEYLRLSERIGYLTEQHGEVFQNERIEILKGNVFRQLSKSLETYDVIFVDVPDPVDIELNQYFTKEFYELCHRALQADGLIVTQSGSPYFATTAFQAIQKTMTAADFRVQAYHNQVLTLGEWAWTIGVKPTNEIDLREALNKLDFDKIETEWLNNEAMQMMLSFGKAYVTSGQVRVNTIQQPVIHRYYIQGNYQLQ